MLISLSAGKKQQTPLIIPLFEGSDLNDFELQKEDVSFVRTALKNHLFSPKDGEVLTTHVQTKTGFQPIMLFGISKESSSTAARNTGGKLIKAAKTLKKNAVAILMPKALKNHLSAVVEGLLLGNYDPAVHKTGEDRKKQEREEITRVELVSSHWDVKHQTELKKSVLIAETVNEIRTMVNTGPDQMGVMHFQDKVRQVSHEEGYHLTDFEVKDLKKLGMNAILAVNRGSTEGAHLLILEHREKNKTPPIVLVGKGIVFDTGGICLKVAQVLPEMQLDMAGAAVVLGVFKLLKSLHIKQRVIGVMPITDNAIGSASYHPSEVIRTFSGKTVEVMNTDAEGRLILCDAIAYALEKYKPRMIIDIATLTSACMIALGFRTAGVFGTDHKLLKSLIEAGTRTDESLCELPITSADEKAIKGKIADLTNLPSDHPFAGACRAAAFLKTFVGKTPWAHLDIAGPSFTKDPKDYESQMGTGFGVRLLIDFLIHNNREG